MNRSAVAAPAQEPTDDCNWLPLKAMARTHDLSLMCRRPCVQHFDVRLAGQLVRIHRCQNHTLTDSFIGKLRMGKNQ